MKIGENIPLSQYITAFWLPRKKNEVKISTYTRYVGLSQRIIEYLGMIPMGELSPADAYYFYDELRECHSLHKSYKPTQECVRILKTHYTRPVIAHIAGVGMGTVDALRAGKKVKSETAEKIADILDFPVETLFTVRSSSLSSRTIHHYHTVLHQIIKDSVFDSVLKDNFMQRVRPPKLDDLSEARYLDAAEAKLLMDKLDKYGDYPYVTLLKLIMYTGMRRGEVCGLEWRDIDLENETLAIRRTSNYLPSKGIYTDTPKTKQSRRVIAFDCFVSDMLKSHINAQQKQRREYGCGWINCGRLFTKDDGGAINPSSVTKYFHRFVQEHGLPECCVHSLRHTNASLLLAANTPITTVAGRLGHSDPSTTLRIYSHQLSAENRKAGKAIEKLFE